MRQILLNRDAVKELLPTDMQMRILKFVDTRYEVKSTDVAVNFKISVANASIQLSKMYNNGWLLRRDAGDPTGGITYIYRATY
jgi:predicted transcriptional regulator